MEFRQSLSLPAAGALALLVLLSANAPTMATVPGTLRLDGSPTSDAVIVANAPELNPTGGITIEAWIRQLDNSGCQTPSSLGTSAIPRASLWTHRRVRMEEGSTSATGAPCG